MSEYIIDYELIPLKWRDGYGLSDIDLTEEVVRCRDCAYSINFFHHDDERWQCTEPHQEGDDVKPDAYCWRCERKEGGDD